MTKEEFFEKQRIFAHGVIKLLKIYAVIGILGLLIFFGLGLHNNIHLILFGSFVVIFILSIMWNLNRLEKTSGLICPNCGKSFSGKKYIPKTVFKCFHCGHVIFDDSQTI
jgi:predicted RNA-binding Zn-ribbon protein involved in translation (DUF1610 family)